MKFNVLIAESNGPEDYYRGRLDGEACASLLKTIQVKHIYKTALDEVHFEKAIHHSIRYNYDVLHISCHGQEKGRGIILCDNAYLKSLVFQTIILSGGNC